MAAAQQRCELLVAGAVHGVHVRGAAEYDGAGASLRAELPAVKKEDVRITFDDGTLTISGERKQKTEEKKEKMHRVETFYGTFARSFELPDNADAASIRAESKDGVITVHVAKAKSEPKKATEIKVQ